MRLVFVNGGSRFKKSEDGRWFTDPNFTKEVWQRYMDLCDEFVIILRQERRIYSIAEAESRFNPVLVNNKIKLVPVEDITHPKCNIINIFKRKKITKTIRHEVAHADKIIIRSASFYTNICQKACIDYNKPYIFEVTGFILEVMSHHSLMGRLLANYFEHMTKRMAANAECAIYVSDEALQKRYPCKKMLGCSDVVLNESNENILKKRLVHIDNKIRDLQAGIGVVKLGTAAFLDVKWKGQENVIRAIAELKKKGITNIQYEMIGIGQGLRLIKLSKKLGIENQVKVLGPKPHNEVFSWLDSIDIYIQPSYQEGLCRAIVEAISRACPVIASDTGGNYELINKDYIFPCGDYIKLSSLILTMKENYMEEAKRNFQRAAYYKKSRLDSIRSKFMKEFMK